MRSIVIASALAVVLFAGLVLADSVDSHHVNFRWILWKHHLWPYQPDLALRYLNVDLQFRNSLHGRSKAEVQRWFPILRPKKEPVTPSQKYYSGDGIVQGPDFFWIDDSTWAVWFADDKLIDIEIIKG